jgi:site-specific DNA recombinase
MEYNIKYVAIYLRKSRGDDEDLAKHESILTDICKKQNWKYIEFREIGTSDSIELRPKFQKLLNDIEEEIFDAVLVVDYDRLSRGDMGQQDKIKKIFKNSKTLIITPQKVYDLNNDIDDTYTDFQGLLARQEYKMIKKRFAQGKKIGARLGNWTNGKPPFGYSYEKYKDKYNEKGLVINDEESPIYKYMIQQSLEGYTPNQVAWDLNKKGIRTRNGKLWSNVAILRILSNETYLGKIISNKSKGDGHKIKKSDSKNPIKIDKKEWIIVDNCHEPLINEFDFEKIQQLINKRLLVPVASRANKAEFTHILKCGCCGATLQLQKKKEGYTLIKPCNRIIDGKGTKCINRGGKFEPVLEEIKLEVNKYKAKIEKNINGNEATDVTKITNQLQEKYKELKKYENALEKVQDSYDLGDYTREEFKNRKDKWESKIIEIENIIERLDRELKSQKSVTNEEKLSRLNEFIGNINNIESIEARNRLYQTIFDSIIWKRIGEEEPELVINFL